MNIKFHIFEGKNSCQVSIFKVDLFFMCFTFRKIQNLRQISQG